MSFLSRLFRIALVLWAGSLWSLALWVTRLLFQAQPDRHLAGTLAGKLFSVETYLGLIVALLAVLGTARGAFRFGYAAVALLLVNQWALRPVMAIARDAGAVWGLSFGAWHGVSMLLYALACCAVLLVIWNQDFR